LLVKARTIPVKIQLLTALLRRLQWDHPKRYLVEKELKRRNAGFWGEKEVDKKLMRIDQSRYYIICDLRLPNGDGTFFQIDTLILSAQFILIIESKNIAGTLYFDLVNHQFYRIKDNGEREVFSDPVSQARLHQQQLREWLKRNKLPSLPLEFLVTSTNPHSLFHITPTNHPNANKICNIAALTWEIDELGEQYQQDIITDKDIRKIGKALTKSHTPLNNSEIRQQYEIDKSELLTGVHCPECEYLPLTIRVGKWFCPKCNKTFKDVLFGTIEDYFLLINPTITNSEFRWFFQISSPLMANRKLNSLNLQASGTNKGTYYKKM
jgi:ribosomal protein L37AE/L43A